MKSLFPSCVYGVSSFVLQFKLTCDHMNPSTSVHFGVKPLLLIKILCKVRICEQELVMHVYPMYALQAPKFCILNFWRIKGMQCYYSELEFFGRKTFLSVHFSMVTISNPTCNLTLELKSTTQAPIMAWMNWLAHPMPSNKYSSLLWKPWAPS